MTEHAVEGEVVEASVAMVPSDRANLFEAQTGAELVVRATERATALAEVVRKQKLSVTISGREHVRVEGWTLLGSMLGVFPVTESVKELRDKDGALLGFEARVEARTLGGQVVGAALSRCMFSENTWKNRDQYALLSMAQTRATSKALRMPLGFVMSLAGFDPTPAEEMPREPAPQAQTPAPAKPKTDPWKAATKAMTEFDITTEAASRIVAFNFAGKQTKDLNPDERKLVAGYLKAFGKQKLRVLDALGKLEGKQDDPGDLNLLAPDALEVLADALQAKLAAADA